MTPRQRGIIEQVAVRALVQHFPRRLLRRRPAAVVCLLATAFPASAQDHSLPSPLRSIHLAGGLRTRVEHWGWFSAPPADSSYTYGAAVLRLKLSQSSGDVEWQVEGSFPVFLGLPRNAVAEPAGPLGYGADYYVTNGKRNIAAAVLRQAFIALAPGSPRWTLRVGRFEFADGAEAAPADADLAALKADRVNQRLLGVFNYAVRSLDGAHLTVRAGSSNFTVMAARLVEGSFQLRALAELDAEVAYAAYTRSLGTAGTAGELRLFAIAYQDRRGTPKVDNRAAAQVDADRRPIRLLAPGAHYIFVRRIGPGALDAVFWGAAQFGRWGVQRHHASALAAETGYRLRVKGQPWARAGYFRASGDSDPGDREHNTFFPILSSPRAYARMPFYVLMNADDRFLQLRASPRARLGMRFEYHSVRLVAPRDLWYDGGGAFQNATFGYLGRPSGGRAALGRCLDVSLDYALSPRTGLAFYAGAARGRAAAAFVFPAGGQRPPAWLLSAEMTRRF